MVTRHVELTEAQSALVDRLVSAGRYGDASEAMRAGLRLLEREEVEIEELRTRLEAGLAEARDGDFAEGTGEEVIRRVFSAARRGS